MECWIGGKETEVSQGSRSSGTGKHGVSRDSGKREKIHSREVGCGDTPIEQSGKQRGGADILYIGLKPQESLLSR